MLSICRGGEAAAVSVVALVLVEPQSRRVAGANELPRELPQVLLRV
eukprot:SAG22_NODE_17634_length_301_cov_1.019802_1_plen_45_part_01